MAKRRNSKLFNIGTMVSVDIETGEETPIEGSGLRMLPGPPGSCEWCHATHPPHEPHNQQSLPYQIKFHTLYGRYPTWTDAMAHCEPTIRERWKQELIKVMQQHGLETPDDLRDDQSLS